MENQTQETQNPVLNEELIQKTATAKGFRVMTAMAAIMQRHNFSLNETKGGRIYADNNANLKLRRKKIRGQPDQNYVFESYKTVDNQGVPVGEVEISSKGFTPAMLITAVAAKVSREGNAQYNSVAVMLLQAAAALLSEGEKSKVATAKLVEERGQDYKEMYTNLASLTARANGISALTDIIANLVSDNDQISSGVADEMMFIGALQREAGTEGSLYDQQDKDEASDTLNMFLSAITEYWHSDGSQTIMEMAEEYRNVMAEQATLELSNVEQK